MNKTAAMFRAFSRIGFWASVATKRYSAARHPFVVRRVRASATMGWMDDSVPCETLEQARDVAAAAFHGTLISVQIQKLDSYGQTWKTVEQRKPVPRKRAA